MAKNMALTLARKKMGKMPLKTMTPKKLSY